jgi:glycosyltransferase involved in cell wall biosynthesis
MFMHSPGKICFVQTSRTYYGAERSLATMANYLVRRGWGVKVVSLAPGDALDAFVVGGLDAVCYRATRVRDFRNFRAVVCQLAALFKDWGPDIVAANMVKAYLYMAPATVGTSCKRYLFAHGFAGAGLNFTNIFEYLAYLVPPDILIANSQATLASYARCRYLRARHADFIYPPCEPPAPRPKGSSRARPYFVSVGRLHPEKGFDVFVEAAAAISNSCVDMHFLVVGGRDETVPGYMEKLKRLAARSGLGGRLEFINYRREVTALLNGAVAYVNPTTATEGFGRVILEAMQFGVPVIATDCGGPRELVVDGITGFLVPPGDAAALTAKMKVLLDDPSLAKRMGEAGRRRAETEFAAAKSLSKLDGLFGELVTEG